MKQSVKRPPLTQAEYAARIAAARKLQASQKPLTRGAPPKQRKPPKARNAKRGGHRFAGRKNVAYRKWIQGFQCAVLQVTGQGDFCCGPIDPAHVFQTQANGAYDVGEIVPLCRWHHGVQEGKTESFSKYFGVDLRLLAQLLGKQWLETHPDDAPRP